MRFAPTDDQRALREAVRDLFADRCPPASVRKAWETDGPAFDTELWKQLADMGVLGLLAPEGAGGLGLSEVEGVLVLEEAGYAGLPAPLAEHMFVATTALAAAGTPGSDHPGELLAAMAAGEQVATAALPGAAVAFADVADVLVQALGGVVHAVRLSQADVVLRETVDKAYRTAGVTWHQGMGFEASDADLLAAHGALAAAAQLVGLSVRLLELAVAHVKVRTQFGVPIGSQQAVKHHLANVRLGIEYARPVVWRAAYGLAHREATAARDCSFAKVYAGNAAWTAAKSSLQCHGAIGYSAEHDLHLFLKRVWALDAAWGTRAKHRRVVADAVVG